MSENWLPFTSVDTAIHLVINHRVCDAPELFRYRSGPYIRFSIDLKHVRTGLEILLGDSLFHNWCEVKVSFTNNDKDNNTKIKNISIAMDDFDNIQ